MKKLVSIGFIFCIVSVIFACTHQDDKQVHQAQKVVSKLPSPFHKHLKVEVGPELIFDVFSWGRGADSTSSLLILRSDSLKNEFSVASSDNIEGRLKEVFNTDMDDNGNPEIVVYYTSNDPIKSAQVLCYEFTGKNVHQIRFPDLTAKTKKQYRGLDNFYVKEGKLYREFNLYHEDDTEAKKPIGRKKVEYFLKNNSFDLKEVE